MSQSVAVKTQADLFGNHPIFDVLRNSTKVSIDGSEALDLVVQDLDRAQSRLQASTLNFTDWKFIHVITTSAHTLTLSTILDLVPTNDPNVFSYKKHQHASEVMFMFS